MVLAPPHFFQSLQTSGFYSYDGPWFIGWTLVLGCCFLETLGHSLLISFTNKPNGDLLLWLQMGLLFNSLSTL